MAPSRAPNITFAALMQVTGVMLLSLLGRFLVPGLSLLPQSAVLVYAA